MNLKKIIFSTIVIILVCILFFSNYLNKIYKFIEYQADQYLPRYSQVYVEDSIKKAILKAQNEAFNFLNGHLNPDSLDLTLTKILDINLSSLEEKSLIRYTGEKRKGISGRGQRVMVSTLTPFQADFWSSV